MVNNHMHHCQSLLRYIDYSHEYRLNSKDTLIETGACVLISRSKYEKEKEKVQTVKCNKAQIIEQT